MKKTRESKINDTDKLIRNTLSIVGFPFLITQSIISRWQMRKIKPTGKLIDLGTHKIHAYVSGKGEPTIVLDSGLGGCHLDWALVQPSISETATVVSYDRAGYGWSERNGEKSTSLDHVTELKQLLDKLELKPPYILVGHSFGGLNMQLFASMYPEKVAGLVLVDSVHKNWYLPEHRDEKRKKQFDAALKQMRLGYLLSPLGIPRMIKKHIGSQRLPEKYIKIVKTLGYRPSAYKTVYVEYLNTMESAKQLQQASRLPSSLPILIISAGKQDAKWKELQNDLSHLSDNTKQIIIKNSWHSVQIHEPDAVIHSIKEFIENLH